MMSNTPTKCAHCEVPISDPTTQVVHGGMTYCCPNCAHMIEQGGSGSDPQALEVGGDLRCSHCSAVIVAESTMQSRGDEAYCCANCMNAMVTAGGSMGQDGEPLPASDRPSVMR